MLLMVEKDVGDGMCQCVMAYIDTLNHQVMSQKVAKKLPKGNFEQRKDKFRLDEGFTHDYDEDNDKEYILKVDVKYPKEQRKLHCNFNFLVFELNF